MTSAALILLLIVTSILIYCLIGVLFLLAYIWTMKPQSQDAMLGLIVIFWPFVLLIDLVLAIGSQFGKLGRTLQRRFAIG